jgi:serine protease
MKAVLAVLIASLCVSVAQDLSGHYIVVFHPNTTKPIRDYHVSKHQINVTNEYEIHTTFSGYSAFLSKKQLGQVIASKEVAYVESDQMMYASEVKASCSVQNDAIWGLNRISQNHPNLDGRYRFDTESGQGAEVFVIDTGIRVTHNEFEGRAIWGANYVDTQNTDCNGHGTHVAGTVAGKSYGVAKKSTVIAVKVLSCSGSGSNAGVIKGVQFAANPANRKGKYAIANMSLGGGYSKALNDAVAAAVKASITFIVAAGNEQDDACSYSPASEQSAISVGATLIEDEKQQQKDVRADFSNFGTCVKVFAPGTLIKAAWYTSNTATNTISGTSMAAPHVAGVAALHLGAVPTTSPSQMEKLIMAASHSGLIDLDCVGVAASCSKSPNKFLYNNC